VIGGLTAADHTRRAIDAVFRIESSLAEPRLRDFLR